MNQPSNKSIIIGNGIANACSECLLGNLVISNEYHVRSKFGGAINAAGSLAYAYTIFLNQRREIDAKVCQSHFVEKLNDNNLLCMPLQFRIDKP